MAAIGRIYKVWLYIRGGISLIIWIYLMKFSPEALHPDNTNRGSLSRTRCQAGGGTVRGDICDGGTYDGASVRSE